MVEHQQDAAKGIGQHLGMEDKLAKLGWRVEVSGLTALRAGQPAPVGVRVVDLAGRPVAAVSASLELGRPGQASQTRLRLAEAADGHRGILAGIEAGTWVATLRLARGQDLVTLEHGLEVR